ncbi:acyl carrier protein [Candidatus Riflebacteria bacterium]
MEKKVIEIIRKVAKIEAEKEIKNSDDLFGDLGIDSLRGLKIMAEIEEEFDITIPDDRLSEMNTIKKIVETIKTELE